MGRKVMPIGTKVRISSGHYGYVQLDNGDAIEIAFFGYSSGIGGSQVELLWIASHDVTPVPVPEEENK